MNLKADADLLISCFISVLSPSVVAIKWSYP